jgi:hypothetical protein
MSVLLKKTTRKPPFKNDNSYEKNKAGRLKFNRMAQKYETNAVFKAYF